jgi:hypothetical protein
MGQQAGTAQQPFCTFDPVAGQLGAQRDLIVVRGQVQAPSWTLQGVTSETSIVGQVSGSIAGGAAPALHVTGARLYIRSLELNSFQIGLVADGSSSIRLDTVLVDGCKGGGISIDASNFDIRNTTVSGNGPGTAGATSWGGILVLNPPASAPKSLTNVSLKDNKQIGIACSEAITGTGVLASGNVGGDIGATCGFSACSPAGPTCGSQ